LPVHAPGLSAQNWSRPWAVAPPVSWLGVDWGVVGVPVPPVPVDGVVVVVAGGVVVVVDGAVVDVPDELVPEDGVTVGVTVGVALALGVTLAAAVPVSCGTGSAGGGDVTSW
jgi:hypothetical protein